MRHDFRIEGYAFSLRPMALDDAQFVVDIRNQEQRHRYLHPTSTDVGEQVKWFEAYLNRADDFYFVIERLNPRRNEGLVAIHDFSESARSAQWGRWVLVPGSLAAAESALLVYRIAFGTMALQEIFCRTSVQNAAAISFHDSAGLARRTVLKDHFELGGSRYDAVEHVLTHDRWPLVEKKLADVARRVAQRSMRDHSK